MSSLSPSVLFLLPYPIGRAPSQRFRVEALLPLLDEAGIEYTLRPFMTEATWKILYGSGSGIQKAFGILKGFIQRFKTVVFEAKQFDIVFIHREAAPLGPPFFEWYLSKISGKRIIYDFDDAIWIPNTSSQNSLVSGLKAFWKVGAICKLSTMISAGNDYLCAYALKHSKGRVVSIPTVVDTETRYNKIKEHGQGKVVVGWTGSHSTLKYLDELIPVIHDLQQEHDFTFMVIADKEPVLPLKDWKYVPWNPQTEITDLLQIDIGVMPLTADPWSEGKCGFKLIQYLALAIPALASPIGVNHQIIEEGTNGYLCSDKEAWRAGLGKLINDPHLRAAYGKAGRVKIQQQYSVASLREAFIGLFR